MRHAGTNSGALWAFWHFIVARFRFPELCGGALKETVRTELSAEMRRKLFALSNKHDVAHIVASALSNAELLGEDEISTAFKNVMMTAVYRDAQREYAITQVSTALEKADIPHILLKGAVLRNYYPETWLRTSCDIDILVDELDLEKAVQILTDEHDFLYFKKGTHDVSLFTKNKQHIELHFDLVEKNSANSASLILKRVWSTAKKLRDCKYWYEMSDEMFYFYHIAHMAKHFEFGGCGIRPFLDLWLLNHNISFDKEKRYGLLAEGKLLTFAKQAELLSEIWFGGAEHTEITLQMQEYVLCGGVYGTTENMIVVQQQKQGGKFKYILSAHCKMKLQ